jgi:hypothetical protein
MKKRQESLNFLHIACYSICSLILLSSIENESVLHEETIHVDGQTHRAVRNETLQLKVLL